MAAKTLYEQSQGDLVFRKKLQSEPTDSRGQPLSENIPVSDELKWPRVDDKLHFSPVPKKVKPEYDCDGYEPVRIFGIIPITFLYAEVGCRRSRDCNTFQLGLTENLFEPNEEIGGTNMCSGYRRKVECDEPPTDWSGAQ